LLTFYRAEEASEADGKQAKDGEGRPGKLAFVILVLIKIIIMHAK